MKSHSSIEAASQIASKYNSIAFDKTIAALKSVRIPALRKASYLSTFFKT